jgi:hypothetical protein
MLESNGFCLVRESSVKPNAPITDPTIKDARQSVLVVTDDQAEGLVALALVEVLGKLKVFP